MARYVKTVNIQQSGKTVGGYKHRYRLRWILRNKGMLANSKDQLWHVSVIHILDGIA